MYCIPQKLLMLSNKGSTDKSQFNIYKVRSLLIILQKLKMIVSCKADHSLSAINSLSVNGVWSINLWLCELALRMKLGHLTNLPIAWLGTWLIFNFPVTFFTLSFLSATKKVNMDRSPNLLQLVLHKNKLQKAALHDATCRIQHRCSRFWLCINSED